MSGDFNPLQSKLLFARPKRLHFQSAWNEHVPFAMMLVELQRPRVLVELGTHWGVSYCAFCQAVAAAGTSTQCHAVDTWTGDLHTGRYSDEVWDNLCRENKQYKSFSKLQRMTFDEALAQFPDGSVDLLHIDGLHFYEAVKHDFESWLPKMSARGVVLLHDTAETGCEFGVHQLWQELSRRFPSFHFEHGHGLGVLAIGTEQPEAVKNFLNTAGERPDMVRALFSNLGSRLQLEVELAARPPAHKRPPISARLRYKLGRVAAFFKTKPRS